MDGLHTCNQHARPLTRAPAHGRQEEVFARYHSSTHQMMYYTNMWAMLLLSAVMSVTGDGLRALAFVAKNPAVLSKILQFGLMSATGQFFIFFLVRSFSALTLVTVTTTRKFFTVLASVFWFQHKLTLGQWLSVAFVFSGLAWEETSKYIAKQRKKRGDAATANAAPPPAPADGAGAAPAAPAEMEGAGDEAGQGQGQGRAAAEEGAEGPPADEVRGAAGAADPVPAAHDAAAASG